MTLAEFRRALFSRRFTGRSEADFQAAIERRLVEMAVIFQRERRLPGKGGRIDFSLEVDGLRLGIECKAVITGGDTARQLLKYALTEEFDHLVLLTTRAYQLPVTEFTAGVLVVPVDVWTPPTL